MIRIHTDKLFVTISTPIMDLVVPVALWANRESRRNIIKIAKGE
jgi:hypothetical protein